MDLVGEFRSLFEKPENGDNKRADRSQKKAILRFPRPFFLNSPTVSVATQTPYSSVLVVYPEQAR